jgi:hypothetical protein
MADVLFRMVAGSICALVAVPSITRICLAVKANTNPIRRW